MRINRRKLTIMIVLFSCLLFMGVGYALLTATLNIHGSNQVEGSWNVHIIDITVNSKSQSAVSRDVAYNNTSASFAVDLFEEGDYVEYTVRVKNDGNINAVLTDVTSSVTNGSNYISMTNSLEQPVSREGESLLIGATMTFTVRIAVNGQEANLQDSTGSEYTIDLLFNQD